MRSASRPRRVGPGERIDASQRAVPVYPKSRRGPFLQLQERGRQLRNVAHAGQTGPAKREHTEDSKVGATVMWCFFVHPPARPATVGSVWRHLFSLALRPVQLPPSQWSRGQPGRNNKERVARWGRRLGDEKRKEKKNETSKGIYRVWQLRDFLACRYVFLSEELLGPLGPPSLLMGDGTYRQVGSRVAPTRIW